MKSYLTPKNIVVALGVFLSLPALVWALIMILASGMKTVPHMSKDELVMGVTPSLVLLAVYSVLPVLRARLGLPTPLVVACVMAGGVCVFALGLLFFCYLSQAGR